MPALQSACRDDCIHILQMLLKDETHAPNGIFTKYTNPHFTKWLFLENYTLLDIALYFGSNKIIDFLLSKYINWDNDGKSTPLWVQMIERGMFDYSLRLIKHIKFDCNKALKHTY